MITLARRSRPRGKHAMTSAADADTVTLDLFRSLNTPGRAVRLLRSAHGMASGGPVSRQAAMILLCAISDTATAQILNARYVTAVRYLSGGAG